MQSLPNRPRETSGWSDNNPLSFLLESFVLLAVILIIGKSEEVNLGKIRNASGINLEDHNAVIAEVCLNLKFLTLSSRPALSQVEVESVGMEIELVP